MRFRNSADSYGIIAQAFHWLIAAAVFVQAGIGAYVDDLPVSLARLQWLSRHKSLGLSILVLVLLRLAWRAFNRPPAFLQTMPTWERRAAALTHGLLYALLVTAALAGWLHASAAGLGVNLFGVFSVPDIIGRDPRLAEIFHDVHEVLVKSLVVLIVLHVAAALRHAIVLRDGVMQRMLPSFRSREKTG